jgi:hypothetical protein
MKMTMQPTTVIYDEVSNQMVEVENTDHSNQQGNCDKCGTLLLRFRGQGDIDCNCGAIYNCFGQRLRDDLYSRPNMSAYDDDIGDLEGDELSWLRQENY